MIGFGPGPPCVESTLTRNEIATELADLWTKFTPEQINRLLAGNVPVDLLEFFLDYADWFARDVGGFEGSEHQFQREQLPNLLIMGYLIRLLEERLR